MPEYCRRNSMLKVCGIDRYDDLLLLGHRLLAQLLVFASGEHFRFTKFPSLQYYVASVNYELRTDTRHYY